MVVVCLLDKMLAVMCDSGNWTLPESDVLYKLDIKSMCRLHYISYFLRIFPKHSYHFIFLQRGLDGEGASYFLFVQVIHFY